MVESPLEDACELKTKKEDLLIWQVLEKNGVNASREEQMKRADVISQLDKILKQWIQGVAQERAKEAEISKANCKAMPYGSFLHEVDGPSSDLDVCAVCPSYTDVYEDFFGSLVEILLANPLVSDVLCIKGKIPLIKMKFDTVSVDLLCGVVALPYVPEDLKIEEDIYTEGLTIDQMRPVNGPRISKFLAKYTKHKSFQWALKFVKLWIKRRGISGNMYGYLGGVSCSILMAKVAQIFPRSSCYELVKYFFTIYALWDWENVPVMISKESSRWRSSGSDNLMPIITPYHPHANCAFNITISSQVLMQREFQRGLLLALEAETLFRKYGQLSPGSNPYEKMVEPAPFFSDFEKFIKVEISAESKEAFEELKGLTNVKLKKVVKDIESFFVRNGEDWSKHFWLCKINPTWFEVPKTVEKEELVKESNVTELKANSPATEDKGETKEAESTIPKSDYKEGEIIEAAAKTLKTEENGGEVIEAEAASSKADLKEVENKEVETKILKPQLKVGDITEGETKEAESDSTITMAAFIGITFRGSVLLYKEHPDWESELERQFGYFDTNFLHVNYWKRFFYGDELTGTVKMEPVDREELPLYVFPNGERPEETPFSLPVHFEPENILLRSQVGRETHRALAERAPEGIKLKFPPVEEDPETDSNRGTLRRAETPVSEQSGQSKRRRGEQISGRSREESQEAVRPNRGISGQEMYPEMGVDMGFRHGNVAQDFHSMNGFSPYGNGTHHPHTNFPQGYSYANQAYAHLEVMHLNPRFFPQGWGHGTGPFGNGYPGHGDFDPRYHNGMVSPVDSFPRQDNNSRKRQNSRQRVKNGTPHWRRGQKGFTGENEVLEASQGEYSERRGRNVFEMGGGEGSSTPCTPQNLKKRLSNEVEKAQEKGETQAESSGVVV